MNIKYKDMILFIRTWIVNVYMEIRGTVMRAITHFHKQRMFHTSILQLKMFVSAKMVKIPL